jgi:hypothetical protein
MGIWNFFTQFQSEWPTMSAASLVVFGFAAGWVVAWLVLRQQIEAQKMGSQFQKDRAEHYQNLFLGATGSNTQPEKQVAPQDHAVIYNELNALWEQGNDLINSTSRNQSAWIESVKRWRLAVEKYLMSAGLQEESSMFRTIVIDPKKPELEQRMHKFRLILGRAAKRAGTVTATRR